MEDKDRHSHNDNPRSVKVNSSSTGDNARQFGYVHNYTEYKIDPTAAPPKRFAMALRLLAGKMPREAERVIASAVQDGHRSNKVAYYWALSTLSGRSFDDLDQEHFAVLNKCTAMIDASLPDEWMHSLRVVTQFVGCLVYELKHDRLDNATLNQVFLIYDSLDENRREEIRRHLDLVMTGALQDRVEAKYAEELPRRRMSGNRKGRAWKFFEPDPCPPVLIHLTEPSLSKIRRGMALAGAILAGAALVAAFCVSVASQPVLALALLVGLGLGGYLLATRGRAWLVRQGQLAADAARHAEPVVRGRYSLTLPVADDDDEDDYEWGESDRADARHRWERGRLNLYRWFTEPWVNQCFTDENPDGDNKRKKWQEDTRGLRSALTAHIRRHYARPDRSIGEIDRLIDWHAKRAKRRWESDTLRAHRDELRDGATLDGILFGLGIIIAAIGLICGIAGLLQTNLQIGAYLMVTIGAGVTLVFGSEADAYAIHGDLHRAETSLAEAEYAEETQAFEEWSDRLQGRPTDEEMARWLDYDKFYIKNMAMKDRNRVNRNLIAHAILTEDLWPCQSARILYGPPRYSHYRVIVFLLTEGGVRQVSMNLDFCNGHVSNPVSHSFSYDKIAWAKVAEAGWRFNSGRRRVVVFDEEARNKRPTDDNEGAQGSWDTRLRRSRDADGPPNHPNGARQAASNGRDVKEGDSLVFAQALRLSLVDREPIDVIVENFDRGFLDRLRENKAALQELALDNSGVAGAVRLLDTVAWEGPAWLRLQRERRNIQIDDFTEAQNGPNELSWSPGSVELPELPADHEML